MTNYLQKFNNYFHGIIALPLLAFSILYLEFDSGSLHPPFGGRTYYLESGILFFISVFYVVYMFRKASTWISEIEDSDLQTRLNSYSRILIRFYLLVTLPGVIAVVLMYLTGELGFSLVYLLELFLLSIKRPSTLVIIKDLHLKGREKEIVLRKENLKGE